MLLLLLLHWFVRTVRSDAGGVQPMWRYRRASARPVESIRQLVRRRATRRLTAACHARFGDDKVAPTRREMCWDGGGGRRRRGRGRRRDNVREGRGVIDDELPLSIRQSTLFQSSSTCQVVDRQPLTKRFPRRYSNDYDLIFQIPGRKM